MDLRYSTSYINPKFMKEALFPRISSSKIIAGVGYADHKFYILL